MITKYLNLMRGVNFTMKTIVRFSYALGLFTIAGLGSLLAQDAGVTVEAGMTETVASVLKWLAISSGFGLGIAAAGCGLAQGRVVAAAMEGISRNPQGAKDMFVPMILGLAFMEALVIFALIFVFIFNAAFGITG
jgi:F-type H+-transporting ATPase subunit c